ncbi:type IV secretory system conjugative DNA transfer family protein [Nocardia sp. GCM10030253]|uniref:type IV secretory system conjugative DNA transfer family protein n=1 Tax=Nocardia sp. GCM10030253 TaxID=3273404 RepID=UPI0036351175
MDRKVKGPASGDAQEYAPLIVTGLGFGIAEYASLSVRLAPWIGGLEQDGATWQPLDMAIRLATGDVVWTGQATGAAVGLAVTACAACVGAAVGWRQLTEKKPWQRRGTRKARKEQIDGQARWLARGPELADVRRKAVMKKAADLKVSLAHGDAPGISIGEDILTGKMIYGSYEDLHLDIMGPRAGKSTSRVIPAVMAAIGPVVATSNKRDIVDATRDHRAKSGRNRNWVFDPQGVAEEPATWYWDPISWVLGDDGGRRAQERAQELAGHFAAFGEGSRDAFFDPEGEDLLAGLFLAAAVGKRPITQVYLWVTSPRDQAPVDLLTAAGYEMVAAGLADQYNAPDKQRAGIFATAKKMSACLKLSSVAEWVTPPSAAGDERDEFDPHAFVRSRDTLYPLSKDGKGSAGPLVTALAAAVCEAGTEEGVRHGGRLPVPMLVALDEAANIVRWAQLPAQYSHFGSRGIVVMTILQSYAQGVRCWGADGMKALFGAANIKVLGPGLADAGFLREMSDLIGSHYERTISVTRSKGGSSQAHSRSKETTLEISDLAAIPRGRAVVFISGHRPVMVRTVPWQARPDMAAAVKASLAAHDPARQSAKAAEADSHNTFGGARRPFYVVPTLDDEQEGKSA